MGAALILQSLATDPPLCGVVAESPFSTFREIAYDRVSEDVRTGPWFGRTVGRLPIEFSFLYARLRYGVDLRQASPQLALARSHVPVLLIHGALDTNILPRHSRALFNAAPSHVRLWSVPGAAHTGAWAVAPAEFEKTVLGRFSTHPLPDRKTGTDVKAENDSGASVLLLHGMGDNRSGVAGYAKLFLAHGYRVLEGTTVSGTQPPPA
jgi:fermentation-respiration switch protein FrsA (DUF1100 family)